MRSYRGIPELLDLPAENRRVVHGAAMRTIRDTWRVKLLQHLNLFVMLILMLLLPRAALTFYGSSWNPGLPRLLLLALAFAGWIGTGWLLFRFFDTVIVRPAVRRVVPFLCSTCGYNLTANTSGVCPECGRAIDMHQADDEVKLSGP